MLFSKTSVVSLKHLYNAEHTCVFYQEKLYVIGPKPEIHVFDVQKQEKCSYIAIPSLSNYVQLFLHACVIVQDFLFIVGGSHNGKKKKNQFVHCLHLPSMTWTVENLNYSILECALIARQESLVMYGGYTTEVSNKMLQYPLQTREWSEIEQLNPIGQRLACAHVYDEHSDCLFVHGGANGRHLDDLARFSFKTREWTVLLTQCGIPAYSHAMTVMNHQYLVVQPSINRVFLYDLQLGTYTLQNVEDAPPSQYIAIAKSDCDNRWFCCCDAHLVTFCFVASGGWNRALQSATKCHFTDVVIKTCDEAHH